ELHALVLKAPELSSPQKWRNALWAANRVLDTADRMTDRLFIESKATEFDPSKRLSDDLKLLENCRQLQQAGLSDPNESVRLSGAIAVSPSGGLDRTLQELVVADVPFIRRAAADAIARNSWSLRLPTDVFGIHNPVRVRRAATVAALFE